MFRKFGYEKSIVSIVSAANSHIGLAAAPDYIEIIHLNEAMASGR
jgi:hypothetical protein